MQLYKVKLNNPMKSQPDAHVNEYLSSSGKLALYTRGEAIKKASLFDGKIEPHGKNYDVIEESIVRLKWDDISSGVKKLLTGKEAFVDAEQKLTESTFYGDVFVRLQNMDVLEDLKNEGTIELMDELRILDILTGLPTYIIIG